MNNAINEIKNTLEGTNSRIMEAEDRISDVEDKMVEINAAERKKEQRIQRNENKLWDNVKRPNIRIIGVPEEDKKKGHEKILEEIITENFPKMGKEIATQVQETQRAKHPKTHISQINKDQTQRTNIKSSKRETTKNTQGDSHKYNS